MRIRLPLRRAVFFLAALALALVVLLPLRVAIGWFGLNGRGLAAREAEGSLWLGTLKEAQFGAVPLGDVRARLDLLPLFLGRARLSLSRDEADGRFEGAVSVSRHSFGLDDLTGQLRVGALFAPLPIATLDLVEVTAHFAGGVCDHAEGEVRAGLGGDVGGILLANGLRGSARCAEGALLLPLTSQSGMEQLNLRFAADGRWRIDLIVRPTDPAAIARLTAAGFGAGPGGAYVRRTRRFVLTGRAQAEDIKGRASRYWAVTHLSCERRGFSRRARSSAAGAMEAKDEEISCRGGRAADRHVGIRL